MAVLAVRCELVSAKNSRKQGNLQGNSQASSQPGVYVQSVFEEIYRYRHQMSSKYQGISEAGTGI